ncbi:MAG TPA: YbhB/YbcL family Raf kinase inhibitor-like protein [Candidatus Saccharimonadales bacterium]|nr:YbhB/YbcL family Raf kinase inhibitor-like protein [Candidatus Saccharimonadales bacterium]
MKLKSTDFNDYFFLPKSCGYKFGNKPPTLYAKDLPEGTTNLALAVYDTEVVYYDRELTYWLVWNLPIDVGEFSDDTLPAGAIQGTNDMGTVGYYGPTLEREIHHIHFLLFALNSELLLGPSAGRKEFDAAVNGRFIDHADMVGMYQPERVEA